MSSNPLDVFAVFFVQHLLPQHLLPPLSTSGDFWRPLTGDGDLWRGVGVGLPRSTSTSFDVDLELRAVDFRAESLSLEEEEVDDAEEDRRFFDGEGDRLG